MANGASGQRDEVEVRRALLSVWDKRGLVDFARGLLRFDIELLASGGTARALEEAGLPHRRVEDYTGSPEILQGRVKTLHPKVHGGILYRRDLAQDASDLERIGAESIDLVAVNLYPFETAAAKPGVTWDEAVEEIDIGGPCLLRSAAKNHAFVTVASSPDDYAEILEELETRGGRTSLSLRRRLARRAFERTASYDRAIAAFFAARAAQEGEAPPDAQARLPDPLEIRLPRARVLRYGENPHQEAALYGGFLSRLRQLHGRDLSYNNILDLASGLELVRRLRRFGTAVAIIKHTNPCGAALGGTLEEAWERALAADPWSASGGIIVTNAPVEPPAAERLKDHFIEVLAAPAFAPEALESLKAKKNRILIELLPEVWEAFTTGLDLRSAGDSILVQTPDLAELDERTLRVVTRRKPSPEEMAAMRFGWEVVRSVKSNAIVYARSDRTLGIGAGQMSRVDAARLGAWKAAQAGLDLKGSAVASDAFFPFADGVIAAAEAGASCVIQPGGSVRDREVIEACDARGLAMVFTGVRHFRH